MPRDGDTTPPGCVKDARGIWIEFDRWLETGGTGVHEGGEPAFGEDGDGDDDEDLRRELGRLSALASLGRRRRPTVNQFREGRRALRREGSG